MALLALAPACGFSSNGGDDGGGTVDAAPACYGEILKICFPASKVPTMPQMLGTTTVNTDMTASGSLCNQDNNQKTDYCVVAGSTLTLMAGATLTAQGLKPLVLLSTTTMDLAGDIDVSSHHAGQQLRGAGANPTDPGACSFMTAPTEAMMGGGGYGGSFGTKGGDGGNAAEQTTGKGAAGTRLDSFPMTLRGGCRGGDGSTIGGSPGAGGDGGGAIALIAGMQIHVDSKINASGGGGHGGSMGPVTGGGGGGSGGMIVFDSPMPLMFGGRATLWANGGGGGQGSSPTVAGDDGGESIGPPFAAFGTNGSGTGGNGSSGSTGADPGAAGRNAPMSGGGGGGGGGGGAGYVHGPGLSDPGLISPPSSGP